MTGTAQPERGKKEALVRIVKRAELSNNKRMLLRLVCLLYTSHPLGTDAQHPAGKFV